MDNSQFFQANYQANRNKWLSAEGEGYEFEAGAGTHGDVPISAPYVIQIVNACTSAIASVDIGDSYANRAGVSAGHWNFNQDSNITISSTIIGVTYLEFLSQSESKPFKVGATMAISTSAGQLEQSIAITHRNASGDRQDHVLTPTLDPYQEQTDRIIDDYEYLFDGYTRLRINQVNGSATLTIRMYQSGMFTATQLVAGRKGLKNYRPAQLVRTLY